MDARQEIDKLKQEIARLEKEKKEWKDKYIDLDKSLKAELRDPNGTIWEYAERLEKENQDLNNENFKLRAIACNQSGELARLEKEVEGLKCKHEVKNSDCICVKCGACLNPDCIEHEKIVSKLQQELARIKGIISEEKAKWSIDDCKDNPFATGIRAGIEAVESRLEESSLIQGEQT